MKIARSILTALVLLSALHAAPVLAIVLVLVVLALALARRKSRLLVS